MGCSCLKCCTCLCCCLLVVTNIFAMVLGALLTIVGVFLTFGFSMFSGVLKSTVTSATSSITSTLKTNMNIDLDIYSLLENISSVTGSMGAALMVIGIIVIVLACFGCCGACCKAKVCLIIYVIIIGLFFLAQLIAVIIWFANANLFKSNIKKGMEESLKQYTGLNSKNIQSLLQNLIQIFVGCCGVNNGTDFETMSPNWNRTYTVTSSGSSYTFNLTYPETCCKFNISTFQPIDTYCPYNNTNTLTSNYQKGCYSELLKFLETSFKLDYIFYALAGILGYQALLIAGAIIIYKASDSNKVAPG